MALPDVEQEGRIGLGHVRSLVFLQSLGVLADFVEPTCCLEMGKRGRFRRIRCLAWLASKGEGHHGQ